jgi:hypothetical protein
VAANAGLAVDEGAATALTATQLRAVSSAAAPAGVTYTLAQPPARGVLRLGGAPLAAGGTFTQADIVAGRLSYAHDGSETRADALVLGVADGVSQPLTGLRFAIAVRPVNDRPLARADAAQTDVGRPVAIDVLANDNDAEGGRLSLLGATVAAHGAVTIGGGVLLYTPARGYAGLDSFAYTVSDPDGATATAHVSVRVGSAGAPGARTYLPLLAR